jgi:ribosomal protein L19
LTKEVKSLIIIYIRNRIIKQRERCSMNTFTIGQTVKVTFGVLDGTRGRTWEFESEVMDIVDNDRNKGVWVDHPELRGEDMLFVELTNPHINKVEAVTTVEREVIKETDMKEAKKVIQKAIKWEEDDITVSVKIYDCFEDDFTGTQQSYDVEIQWAIGEDTYTDCVVTDTYYSNVEGDEVALKDAQKRAKAVLRTVKGWFAMNDQVTVVNDVEVYHA